MGKTSYLFKILERSLGLIKGSYMALKFIFRVIIFLMLPPLFTPCGVIQYLSKQKCLKNEARHLTVARKFYSDLHDIWSFSTLFWTKHWSTILILLFPIEGGGDPCKTVVKKSRQLSCPQKQPNVVP